MLAREYISHHQAEYTCATTLFSNEALLFGWRPYMERVHPELKTYNREINKRRIGIEHVFGKLKTFKILAGCYRSRGKRLGLRFNLIAGIYNLELSEK
ncbi:transposase family protein [Acinetobacter sp. ANC 5383]